MERVFSADTLADLRKEVLGEALAAGLSDDRATEVMLAVHELAANTVRHGGGVGLARAWVVDGELHCMVSDMAGSANGDAPGPDVAEPPSWQVRRGHGLWLVRATADRFSVLTGPEGSEVTAVFTLPSQASATATRTAERKACP